MAIKFAKQKYALVVKEFVSEDERIELRDRAINYRENGVLEPNPGGPFRFAKKIFDTEYCDELVRSIGDRVIASFGISDCEVDPYIGWAFFASDFAHATQVIQGEQPRIVYQFGFTVSSSYELPGNPR